LGDTGIDFEELDFGALPASPAEDASPRGRCVVGVMGKVALTAYAGGGLSPGGEKDRNRSKPEGCATTDGGAVRSENRGGGLLCDAVAGGIVCCARCCCASSCYVMTECAHGGGEGLGSRGGGL